VRTIFAVSVKHEPAARMWSQKFCVKIKVGLLLILQKVRIN